MYCINIKILKNLGVDPEKLSKKKKYQVQASYLSLLGTENETKLPRAMVMGSYEKSICDAVVVLECVIKWQFLVPTRNRRGYGYGQKASKSWLTWLLASKEAEILSSSCSTRHNLLLSGHVSALLLNHPPRFALFFMLLKLRFKRKN